MTALHPPTLVPGQRVRVVQTVNTRDGPWQTEVEGEVVSCRPEPTGSWFAHGKNDRFWLLRLRLRRDDGELVDLTLDDRSQVSLA